MQVPNNVVEKLIPMLLRTVGVSSEDVIEVRDELIRCQERDRFQIKEKQYEDTELHENIYMLSGMLHDWLNNGNEIENSFTGGTGQAMQDVIEWAKEFTDKNKGRDWDGEWYDELEEFFSAKMKSA